VGSVPGSGKEPSSDIGAIILRAAFDELVATGIGVDPLTATLMLAGAINADVLFTDSPISAAYVEQVPEIFLRGIRPVASPS
jgi:hypothetical protein